MNCKWTRQSGSKPQKKWGIVGQRWADGALKCVTGTSIRVIQNDVEMLGPDMLYVLITETCPEKQVDMSKTCRRQWMFKR